MGRSQRHLREIYDGGKAPDAVGVTEAFRQAVNPPVSAATRTAKEQSVGQYRVADAAPAKGTAMTNQTVARNVALTPYQFATGCFTDADSGAGDTLTYFALEGGPRLRTLPVWLTFTPGTRTFSGTPTAKDVGVLTVRVYAVDRAAKLTYSEFTITVT